ADVIDAASGRFLCLLQSLFSTAGVIVDRDDQRAVVLEYTFEEFVDVVRHSFAAAKGERRKAELDERVGVLLPFRPKKSLCVSSRPGVGHGAVACRLSPLPAYWFAVSKNSIAGEPLFLLGHLPFLDLNPPPRCATPGIIVAAQFFVLRRRPLFAPW